MLPKDEDYDIYCEIVDARLKEVCGYIDDDKNPGKCEAMRGFFAGQLEHIWCPEFVEFYKNGKLEEIMKKWDLYEETQK